MYIQREREREKSSNSYIPCKDLNMNEARANTWLVQCTEFCKGDVNRG